MYIIRRSRRSSTRLAATYTHACARPYLPAAFILALTHTRAQSRRCPCACTHLPCHSSSRLARPRSRPAAASAGRVSYSSKPDELRSPMGVTGAANARRVRERERDRGTVLWLRSAVLRTRRARALAAVRIVRASYVASPGG